MKSARPGRPAAATPGSTERIGVRGPRPTLTESRGAEQLGADVVAERIVAGRRSGSRSVPSAMRNIAVGRVDVVVLGEHREAQHAAVGIDLLDFLARHPAQDIEVVDREVAEQAARRGDVRLVRWGWVVASEPDGIQRPEFARLRPAGAPPCSRGRSGAGSRAGRARRCARSPRRRRCVVEVARQRLLAERRQASRDRRPDQARRAPSVAAAMTTASASSRASSMESAPRSTPAVGGDLRRPARHRRRDDHDLSTPGGRRAGAGRA